MAGLAEAYGECEDLPGFDGEHEVRICENSLFVFIVAVPYAKAKYITENSAVQTAMLSEPLGSATYGSHNTVRPYLYVTAYDALSFQNQSIQLISGRFPQKGDELLISPVMVADSGLGLKPGSTLHLAFGKRNIPNYDLRCSNRIYRPVARSAIPGRSTGAS